MIQEIQYASSVDGTAPLYADVAHVPNGKAKPIVAVMHGYNGDRGHVANDLRDLAAADMFCVAPDMRGRGHSSGKFDSGGIDTHDILDALLEAAKKFPSEVDKRNVNIIGYSGGGGNCFSAFVRFPDLFHVVAPFFGIADYGTWYRLRAAAYGKDMEAAIGGSPDKVPMEYAARDSTLAAANNHSASLHLFWDSDESQCPPVMTEKFLESYHAAGLTNATTHISTKGDAARWFHGYRADNPMLAKADDILVKKILSPVPDLSLPRKGDLVVCGYVVTRSFQVFVEDGRRGVVGIEYDLTGIKPKLTAKENPNKLAVKISFDTPLHEFALQQEKGAVK